MYGMTTIPTYGHILLFMHVEKSLKKLDLERSPQIGQISLAHNAMCKIAIINLIVFCLCLNMDLFCL